MDEIPSIFKNALNKLEEKENGFLHNAIKLAEKKNRNMFNIIDKFAYRIAQLKPKTAKIMQSMKSNPFLPKYILNSVKLGKSKYEILSEDFHIDVKLYEQIEIENNADIRVIDDDYINNFLLLNRDINNFHPQTLQREKKPTVGEIPGDKSMGTVTFDGVSVTERKDRLKKLEQLRYHMETMPKPHTVHIALSKEEYNETADNIIVNKEFIATELAVTHNLETHWIVAAVINNESFRPLVSKIIDEDKYPQQMFTDEFDNWLDDLKSMWVTESLNTNLILYYIDIVNDNFYYDGFIRRWNRVGDGGGAIEAIETTVPKLLESNLQEEFFSSTIYRVNPDDYDTPITIPTGNTFTGDLENEPHLKLVTDPNTNIGCLRYNMNNVPLGTPQTIYRLFGTDENRPKSNALIHLTGCEEQFTWEYLQSEEVKIEIKLPGLTGWLSANKYFKERGFKGDDGQGIVLSYNRVGPSILAVTFEDFNTANCGNQIIMRITYKDHNVRPINRISFMDWRAPNFPDRLDH